MKSFIKFSILILALLAITIFFLYKNLGPTYGGEVVLNTLKDEVEVLYDDYGVPHIYAQNASDAYAALGYVHAKDRLFQMEMMRRVGTGSLAELLGQELVEIDQFFRTLGLPAHAKMTTEKIEKQGKGSDWLDAAYAYLEGINRFIEEDNLPLEYGLLGTEPRLFTLEDIHAVTGYMSFTFAMALQTDPLITKIANELGQAYLDALAVHTNDRHIRIPTSYPQRDSLGQLVTPALGISELLEAMPVPPFLGSNGWVISGERTASGLPIFCNDTHIGFAQPSVWYEAHLEYPGFSFYGNHLAGFPFALIGHSRRHSVGLTMFENDDFDLYMEKLNPENDQEVIFNDAYERIQERWDTIRVKDSEPIIFKIRSTRHGNIMNGVQKEIAALTDQPVSAWWVYLLEESRALEATWKMAHANSIQEVEEGVRLIHAPGLNVMYGDAENNIAWWAAAKLPKRPAHVNSKLFLDGSGADEIEGWYPFEDNPMSINPEAGFVHSANNQPDTLANGDLYPGYYYPGYRSQRIMEVISAKDDWTQETIKSLHLDTYTPQHLSNLQVLLAALDENEKKEHSQVIDKLTEWKGTHEIRQIAPTIYYKWLYHTLALMMEDELGESGFSQFLSTFMRNRSVSMLLENENSAWWDNVHTEEKESRNDIINQAFDISIKELKGQLGNQVAKWDWSKVISLEHEHPLAAQKPLNVLFNVKAPFVEGSDGAVNKLEFKLSASGLYKVKSGPAMRIIIDFADVEASESILPTGQSGDRFSPFYKDQAGMYVNGEYRPQLMKRQQIEEVQTARLLMSPYANQK